MAVSMRLLFTRNRAVRAVEIAMNSGLGMSASLNASSSVMGARMAPRKSTDRSELFSMRFWTACSLE
jgi:hypothetical protein